MSTEPSQQASSPNISLVLSYLGLPSDYEPSPTASPVEFLNKHLHHLPPNHLALFSSIINPRKRSIIPAIRNRRLRYTESEPAELSVSNARTTWPTLWHGKFTADLGRETAKEEQEWAEKQFLEGKENSKQVGKLGALLSGYEEERGAELARDLRRKQREWEESLPEEDEDTDDEEDPAGQDVEEMSAQEADNLFARRIKERFIYGLLDVRFFPHHSHYFTIHCSLTLSSILFSILSYMCTWMRQSIDYDRVDWDDQWEPPLDRDEEERWFDEEEPEDSESLSVAD